MAGGQGERFWPMTHAGFPKYRLRFDGRTSLLVGTERRLAKVYGEGNVHVVTTAEHASFIREELPKLPKENLIIEPVRNNTAAAIYLSCARIERRFDANEIVSFFPADHLIQDEKTFAGTVNGAIALAEKESSLVTIGIKPSFPATGYGYVKTGKPVKGHKGAFRVERFVEKPDLPKAKKYVKDGGFLWNAGIFTWRTQTFMDAMRRYSPEFPSSFRLEDLETSYKKLPNLSIDYALLEKAGNISVFKTAMDWCDMGNWDMLYDKSAKDAAGNGVQGDSRVKDCKKALFVNQASHPLVALGLDDIVVVHTERGTLVARRGRAEEAALFFKKSTK